MGFAQDVPRSNILHMRVSQAGDTMSSLSETERLLAAYQASATALQFYTPNPGGQVLFERTPAHEIILSGANNCGKTYSGCVKAAHHIIPEKDKYGKRTGYTIHPHRRIRIKPDGVYGWISTWSVKTQRGNMQPVIDKILGPYETKKLMENGVRTVSEFETGRIVYRQQTQDVYATKGDKIDFCWMDEPHRPGIYNEIKARMPARKGTMWLTATFVMDESYAVMQTSDVMYVQEQIIEPWLREPEKFPLRDVIFMSAKENAQYFDIEFMEQLFANLPAEARMVRMTGRSIMHIGQCCFDEDKLTTLANYLEHNTNVSEPLYGMLEYDETEDDEWQIVFHQTRDSFPRKPKGEFIIKIWEHPIDFNSNFVRPRYYIGVDASEGRKGGDFTAASVIRGDSGEEVAALHGHLSEVELAKQLYLLGMYYCDRDYRPAMLGIETNGIGKAALSYLISGHKEQGVPVYGVGRLYHRPAAADIDRGVKKIGSIPGWYTSPKTRNHVIAAARRVILNGYNAIIEGEAPLIKDRDLIYEAQWFILNKNGKYEAKTGIAHDDRLFARAIAEIVREQYHPVQRPKTPQEQAEAFTLYSVTPDGQILAHTPPRVRQMPKVMYI